MHKPIQSQLGRLQPNRYDPEHEKLQGWRYHGILVIAENDPRLTWPERELIGQIGAKLYGRRHQR